MKTFEYQYLCLEPFLPVLYQLTRRRILRIAKSYPERARILDVGGRKSHYTIGVPGDVTITDLPRETDLQGELHLGVTPGIVSQLQRRRSNVSTVLLDDMTRSTLPSESFDCVVAIEVIEHVEEDEEFIRQVYRVLRPNGVLLLTTPNGQHVTNTNPDHKRHYTKSSLTAMLGKTFDSVEVECAVRSGYFYDIALRSWSLRQPARTLGAMLGAVVNRIQSLFPTSKATIRTQELFATARKHD